MWIFNLSVSNKSGIVLCTNMCTDMNFLVSHNISHRLYTMTICDPLIEDPTILHFSQLLFMTSSLSRGKKPMFILKFNFIWSGAMELKQGEQNNWFVKCSYRKNHRCTCFLKLNGNNYNSISDTCNYKDRQNLGRHGKEKLINYNSQRKQAVEIGHVSLSFFWSRTTSKVCLQAFTDLSSVCLEPATFTHNFLPQHKPASITHVCFIALKQQKMLLLTIM